MMKGAIPMSKRYKCIQFKTFVLVLMLVGVVGQAYSSEVVRDMDDRLPRIVVPRDVATIQDAINLIPDGGRVVVHEGRYEEIVTIRGKTVHLVGKGRPQIVGAISERVVDATESVGLVNYIEGGGGTIRGFNFIGGDAAIKGFDRSAPPGALTVKNSTIQGSVRGILWGFSNLVVKMVTISDTFWHGLSINSVLEFTLKHTVVDNSGTGVGLFIKDTGLSTPAEIHDDGFAFNARGGILAINSALSVDDSLFFVNKIGSIRVMGSILFSKNNNILGTVSEDGTGKFGDGIIAMTWIGPLSSFLGRRRDRRFGAGGSFQLGKPCSF